MASRAKRVQEERKQKRLAKKVQKEYKDIEHKELPSPGASKSPKPSVVPVFEVSTKDDSEPIHDVIKSDKKEKEQKGDFSHLRGGEKTAKVNTILWDLDIEKKTGFCAHSAHFALQEAFPDMTFTVASGVLTRRVKTGYLVILGETDVCKYSSRQHYLYRVNKKPEVQAKMRREVKKKEEEKEIPKFNPREHAIKELNTIKADLLDRVHKIEEAIKVIKYG